MTTRPAPYPADTRAKGWRFELDYEQIEQSDTWPLAAEIPMCQHALLMMWMVAWAQTPCGSFPDDEAVIRAKCKLSPAAWEIYREVLMRGWWKADDGRLYHDTLAKRVTEMMRRRRSDSDRQAANRAKKAAESQGGPGGVTRDTPATPGGVGAESSTDNRIPTNPIHSDPDGSVPVTLPGSPAPKPKAARKRKPADTPAPTAAVWDAYSAAYAQRYGVAPVRNASVNGKLAQFVAKLPAEEAPEVASYFLAHTGNLYLAAMHPVDLLLRDAEKLRTEWLTKRGPQMARPAETAWQQSQRERAERFTGGLVSAKPPGQHKPMEVLDAAAPEAH